MAVVDSSVVFCRPTAVCFTSRANARDLFVGYMNGSVHCLTISSDRIQVTGTAIFSIEANVPVSGLACSDGNVCVSSPCPKNGGILSFQKCSNDSKSPNLQRLLDNNSQSCSFAHSVCVPENSGLLFFTYTGTKQIKSFNAETREVKTVVGTSEHGNVHESMTTARFTQPTGICTEQNSIFVVDTSIGALKLVTSALPLEELLSNLSTLLRTFGVHTSNVKIVI